VDLPKKINEKDHLKQILQLQAQLKVLVWQIILFDECPPDKNIGERCRERGCDECWVKWSERVVKEGACEW